MLCKIFVTLGNQIVVFEAVALIVNDFKNNYSGSKQCSWNMWPETSGYHLDNATNSMSDTWWWKSGRLVLSVLVLCQVFPFLFFSLPGGYLSFLEDGRLPFPWTFLNSAVFEHRGHCKRNYLLGSNYMPPLM